MAEIDREAARLALTKHAGNRSAAARELGVSPAELRAFAHANRDVLEAALEAEERALDKAEAALKRAIRKGSLESRMKAAGFVARRANRFRRP